MRSTAVKVVSDGVMKVDGGAMFGQVPKVAWEHAVPTDRKNRILLGLNCLLLHVGGKNVLVDTGVGSKEEDVDENAGDSINLPYGRLLRNLKKVDLTAKDIDTVILSHLHFDHSGGCTRADRNGNPVAAFPNARYYVQRACWEEARNPGERCSAVHRPQNFMPIAEQGQLELLDGDTEILPGLSVAVADGHARGHQIVMFNHGGERVVFVGDLIPTVHHLNPMVISAFDYSPELTLERKREVLLEAERDDWLLVFPHGYNIKAGYLERRAETLCLRPVEL